MLPADGFAQFSIRQIQQYTVFFLNYPIEYGAVTSGGILNASFLARSASDSLKKNPLPMQS